MKKKTPHETISNQNEEIARLKADIQNKEIILQEQMEKANNFERALCQVILELKKEIASMKRKWYYRCFGWIW